MKTNELRDLTMQELQDRVETESKKYDRMVLGHRVTPMDKPSTITAQRKLVARLKTVLTEKMNEPNVSNQ